MSKRSFTNGECVSTAPMLAGPVAANSQTANATHLDFPPPPQKSAPVAAPKAGRSAAKSRSVRSAEAVSTGVRIRRDRVSVARASSSPHLNRSAIPSGEDRSAAAQAIGDTESPANCLPVGAEETVAAADDEPTKIAAGTKSMDEGRAIGETSAAAALSRQSKENMAKQTPESNARNLADLETLKVPTDPEALADGPAYVRSVAQHVDLVGASARLVVSQDEKVSKAELDRLRELIFGKGGPAPSDEPLRIDWTNVPRPERDRIPTDEISGGESGDR